MSSKIYLHFTLGPVQSFVTQARRTRDIWAGSFLLSYLAGQAMYAVLEDDARIVFPSVQDKDRELTDRLLIAISNHKKGLEINEGPFIGTLPNRFKAEVPEHFDPACCQKAVAQAWRKIADAVWDNYVARLADRGSNTKQIWDRQINSFWDIAWVLSEDEESDHLLDCRKNWRSFVPEIEHGDKCTVMGNLQEISGYFSSRSREEREYQRNFWSAIRGGTGEKDLRSDERLCAISLVKRFFPQVSKRCIGWKVPVNYPSTVYLSAVHWMKKMLEQKGELVEEFLRTAENSGLSQYTHGEYETKINCFERVQKDKYVSKFINLDGNFFHETTLSNERLWPENSREARKQLIKMLGKFGELSKPFYAVLLMDGDHLGALLQEYESEEVSKGLERFSQNVYETVQNNNGVLIYAGGDDVLALLPMQDALRTAIELRNEYEEAFRDSKIPKGKATISAGIIFTHHHAPLKSVLKEAHRLLDKVAKEKTGRNSLAINVWKTAGPALSWSAPWEIFVDKDSDLLTDLAAVFKGKDGENKQFNSSFFYNIRKRFEILTEESFSTKDNFFLEEADTIDLLAAEYLKNRERKKNEVAASKVEIDVAKKRIEHLIKVCREYKRTTEPKIEVKPGVFNFNGALVVRFLAENEVSE